MEGKSIRFPIDEAQRRRNRLGKRAVPCLASERWIEFPEKSAGSIEAGELIKLAVMTGGHDTKSGDRKKICDLLVTRETLLKAINSVKNPETD